MGSRAQHGTKGHGNDRCLKGVHHYVGRSKFGRKMAARKARREARTA